MLKIIFTSEMREYLRQQMVLSNFELRRVLERRRREVLADIERLRIELEAAEEQLRQLPTTPTPPE